ncbi:MAG: HK97 family phage prohead protease [Sphingobacteriaceae bacterium]|nr:HK97 family phage prohead protease [Sphingobacteriaceae bacterium]
MNNIETKSLEQVIKDVDNTGIVTMYVSAFGNLDSDGDVTMPGAFTKTIKENANRVRHFLNHDSRLLIGVPLEMKEDSFGLLVRSKLNLNKGIAKDAYEDYKLYKENDRSLEHSIGFNVVRRDQKDKAKILEYKLWEYSTLTAWAANPLALTVDLKSFKNADEVIVKIKELTEMYNRNYSDGRLTEIEKQLKALDLIAPSVKDTPLDEPQIIDALKQFKFQIQLENYKNGI